MTSSAPLDSAAVESSSSMLPQRRRVLKAIGAACLGTATAGGAMQAAAQLTIEIVGGGADQLPITIVPFGTEDRFDQRVSEVIAADLARSGRFKLQPGGSVRPLPTEPAEVNHRYWKNQGNQTLVIGRAIARSDGRVEVRFRLMDTAREAQLMGFSYTVTPTQLRAIAHKIADLVYEKLTGEPGVFSTRIAYVARNPNRFELHVADADGFNSQFILAHREPIISPAWSPDGGRIAYVSFEQRKSIVFLHDLMRGSRRILANHEGSNSAPAWAPDGERLAVVLSKDGVAQI
jgi:TolB protein